MRLPGRIYVISRSPVRGRIIAAAIRAARDSPRVYVYAQAPSDTVIDHSTVVVLDLRDGSVVDPALTTPRLAAAGWILLARPSESVPVHWLNLAARAEVHLIETTADGGIDEAHLRGAVEAMLERNRIRLVMGVLERCKPRLDRFQELVRAVVADPWRVPRPRDLAVAVGVSLPRLRLRCLSPELPRLDHLISWIRWCAYEYLTAEQALPAARALAAVGVKDRSDFRRQVRRAKAGLKLPQ